MFVGECKFLFAVDALFELLMKMVVESVPTDDALAAGRPCYTTMYVSVSMSECVSMLE